MNKKYDVSVIGMGYIGLPTALILAKAGKSVLGVDTSKKIVQNLQSGKIHLNESALKDLFIDCSLSKKIDFGCNLRSSHTYIICVPTPINKSKTADTSIVFEVVENLSNVLDNNDLVILESTCPVGTTEEISKRLMELRPDLVAINSSGFKQTSVMLAYCPERVFPGNTIKELTDNDRVIGGLTPDCGKAAKELYKSFVSGDCFITSSKTAELAKLTENASRDAQISFANEIYKICDLEGVNVRELIKLCNKHPRVNILTPGIGVGGHCIAVDPWFLINKYPTLTKTMLSARNTNLDQEQWVVEQVKAKIIEFQRKYKKEPQLGVLGLSFKPNIDDFRNSPALNIAQNLDQLVDKLLIHEPNTDFLPNPFSNHKNLSFEQIFRRSDMIIGLVNNSIFARDKLALNVNDKQKLVDFCGIGNEF